MKPNYIGRVIGNLEILRQFTVANHQYFECRCRCLIVKNVRRDHVLSGRVVSCGCVRNEKVRKRRLIHGKSSDPLHAVWCGMHSRCSNPNARAYSNYGGRGIRVCKRWSGPNGFVNFLFDMGPRPSPRHMVDRYPNRDGDYEPGNCRWATARQNSQNMRTNRNVTFRGETRCITEWARILGLGVSTLCYRLRAWDLESAMSVEKRKRKR